jgi:hypothetical protein
MNLPAESFDELQKEWRNAYMQWYAGGMPSFNTLKLEPEKQLTINFKSKADRAHFGETLGYKLTDKTNVLWYPAKDRERNNMNRYIEQEPDAIYETRYPIYIISKGRWETRHTSRALERMGVDYFIAVEPQEYEKYCEVIEPRKVLKLPFSNHGKGSGPARNWCWEHSQANGHKRHWLMDDNISEFWRTHKNKRYRVDKGSAIFRSAENYVDRFENVALAGFQYKFFVVDDADYPPYILNTRIMSCFLIDNDCPEKWRGKFNEDVDLSIRVLKRGLNTMLFYSYLCGKLRTGTVKGGNTSEVYNNYEEDASLRKSQMLKEMHPDVVTLVERYGRTHHHVDLEAIKNEQGQPARQNVLKLKKDVDILNKVDNYGMVLARNYEEPDQYIDTDFSQPDFPTGRRAIHGY